MRLQIGLLLQVRVGVTQQVVLQEVIGKVMRGNRYT